MTEEKYCGDCGTELELLQEYTAANSENSVGGQYHCPDCGINLAVVEIGGKEKTRVLIPP